MTRGELSRERFGFSLPVDDPLYPAPPWHYPEAEFLNLSYETAEEAARAALPADLELSDPATVRMIFASYPSSPVGPYNEALQIIECAWQGQATGFIARILLDNDGAIAGGREIWGYPKKHAYVGLSRDGDAISAVVERPRGRLLVRAHATLGSELPAPATPVPAPCVNLRLIPGTEAQAAPSVCELLEVRTTLTLKQGWSAEGSIEFGLQSTVDNWSALPVLKVLSAAHMRADLDLPYGRVLKRL
jgi:acetoacetate decarboxylase